VAPDGVATSRRLCLLTAAAAAAALQQLCISSKRLQILGVADPSLSILVTDQQEVILLARETLQWHGSLHSAAAAAAAAVFFSPSGSDAAPEMTTTTVTTELQLFDLTPFIQ